MHFFFLVVVTSAWAACMSVATCSQQSEPCMTNDDCCDYLCCIVTRVSMGSWLCIQDSTLLITSYLLQCQ
ncbi:hypothetical protein C8R48DRAFT_726617 [Suillus tomentosus]|nr:hypothetical protein C8R48DRAFT_726617 [Suillus tomentosus]